MAVARWAVLLASIMLAACSTTQSIHVREQEPEGFAPWSDAPVPFRLGAGDRIHVDYRLTPELNEDVTVAPDGSVGLRGAGRVVVQNATPAQAEALIQKAALTYLRNPMVTVGVLETRSWRVTVAGAVKTPGAYALSPRATVLEMVSQAGGLIPESRMTEVVVIRQRPGERPMLRTVNLNRFVSTGAPEASIQLASEDIIFVPRSRIAEVNLWIEENINRVLPFTRSLNYNLGDQAGVIR